MKQSCGRSPPTAIGGMAVESMVDYKTAGTGLPKANVLEFRLSRRCQADGGAPPAPSRRSRCISLAASAPTERSSSRCQ